MGKQFQLPIYHTQTFEPGEFPEAVADVLFEQFQTSVRVEYPSPQTGGQWRLRNRGYVGYLPGPEEYAVILTPNIDLQNVFSMLEYAYRLGKFDLKEIYAATTVQGLYDRIAYILAENVLSRVRRGLYRTYVTRNEQSQTIRGRINLKRTLQKHWDPSVQVTYRDLTADNTDNQLLLYTLTRVVKSGVCRTRTSQKIRKGIRHLRGAISYQEFTASDCVGRDYNRLNEDYERLHALCRLLLETSGPSYQAGDREMVPFHVSMPNLFQRFLERWLDSNLPDRYHVLSEHKVNLGRFAGTKINYRIDLVIEDRKTDQSICVIDAKYKPDVTPTTSDISQVVGYAQAVGTNDAFLLYPTRLADELNLTVGDIRVRSLVFDLEEDVQSSGDTLLESLASLLDVSLSA